MKLKNNYVKYVVGILKYWKGFSVPEIFLCDRGRSLKNGS
jgi:hypothetical protein